MAAFGKMHTPADTYEMKAKARRDALRKKTKDPKRHEKKDDEKKGDENEKSEETEK
tara:strand:- start:472 stop:639 length:168 start_codon:yes stop_codon:yes gene_type:complete